MVRSSKHSRRLDGMAQPIRMSECSPRLIVSQGSDHCPVYGIINETVMVDECEKYILDIANPPGLFIDGKRQSSQGVPQLKLSVRVSGEHAGRRNIRDMFLKASARSTTHASGNQPRNPDPPTSTQGAATADNIPAVDGLKNPSFPAATVHEYSSSKTNGLPATPRTSLQLLEPPAKRQKKTGSSAKTLPDTTRLKSPSPSQQSLMAFLKKPLPVPENFGSPSTENVSNSSQHDHDSVSDVAEESSQMDNEISPQPSSDTTYQLHGEGSFPSVDPIVSKEKWSQLFTKPMAPRCEAHDESCIQRITRKPGVNVGRAFWMCSRLVSPYGSFISHHYLFPYRVNASCNCIGR